MCEQDAFQCNCVIQMTDDEKYLYKDFDDVEDVGVLFGVLFLDLIFQCARLMLCH